jgi:hypothetical protein
MVVFDLQWLNSRSSRRPYHGAHLDEAWQSCGNTGVSCQSSSLPEVVYLERGTPSTGQVPNNGHGLT